MILESKPMPPSPKRALLIVLGIIFGTALALSGMYMWLHETSSNQDKNSKAISKIDKAASLALSQATHDHAFIFAICKRFNRDEQISARIAHKRDLLEKKYPHVGADPVYRSALVALLAENDIDRQNVVQLSCPKAMQKAIATAPTIAP